MNYPGTPSEGVPSTAPPKRIAGLDIARAMAMIGMLSVHIGPRGQDGLASQIYGLPHGRASILFVFLAGIGASLLAGSRGGLRLARMRLLWAALILLPLGLALQTLDHHVAVVLHHYAFLFISGVLLLGANGRGLLSIAAAFAILGPLSYLLGSIWAPDTFQRDTVSIHDTPLVILHALVLSGPYPLITWAAPFMFGMWVGRQNLRSAHTRLWLCLGGATVALLCAAAAVALQVAFAPPDRTPSWSWLMSSRAHSQMPLWLWGAMGSAASITGTALWFGDRAGRVTWPFVALGQLALSMYVAHLVALHLWYGPLTSRDVGEATRLLLMLSAAGIVFAVMWRRFVPRGPLETLLQWPFSSRGGSLASTGESPPSGACGG